VKFTTLGNPGGGNWLYEPEVSYANRTLTIPKALLALHSASSPAGGGNPLLAPGTYRAVIRFWDGASLTFDYYADFNLTDGGTTYPLTVVNGTGDGDYTAGERVTIAADPAPSGKVFDKWTGGNGGSFTDDNSAATIFTMPGNAATVTATYKDSGATTYSLTVVNGSGDGNYTAGAQVTIIADAAPSGQVFDKWTDGSGGSFTDENSATTTFTMPGNAATETATYRNTGSSDRSGSSSSDSSGKSGTDYTAVSTYWIEVPEAREMAKTAKGKMLDYARSSRATITGIRKASLLVLAEAGLSYRHDVMADGAVQIRLYVDDPANATKDILVSGYVKGGDVDRIRNYFEKWFGNKLRVIHFDQQEDFGQPVRIAALVDLTGMDTNNLCFYSYDNKANSYKRIENSTYWIDKNGYLHFTTPYAGDIIISEGLLERK